MGPKAIAAAEAAAEEAQAAIILGSSADTSAAQQQADALRDWAVALAKPRAESIASISSRVTTGFHSLAASARQQAYEGYSLQPLQKQTEEYSKLQRSLAADKAAARLPSNCLIGLKYQVHDVRIDSLLRMPGVSSHTLVRHLLYLGFSITETDAQYSKHRDF